ncbi:MAG: TonB-dependent receptor [Candidatus Cryptobacteroides sp.]
MSNFIRKLVIISVFAVFAGLPAFAQKVTLKFDDAKIQTVLSSIKQQTKLGLVYSDQILDINRKVSINVKDVELSEALAELFKGTETDFEIRNGKIYFIEKKSDSAAKTDVKGTVTDQNGEPITGAFVHELGSPTNGATSDLDGHFSITVPSGASLEISFLGYQSAVVPVKGRNSLNISLVEDRELLDEVIVIGYGSMKRKDLTGATSVVSGAEVEGRKTTNLSLALQGATPGVMVTRSNGDPESTGSIRIRGITTISNADPLVIVDGVPGKLDLINPNDVESITVLKDAASASIYGARAASGVIVVTTKRANETSLDLNYSYEYNFEVPTELPEYVGAQDYMLMVNEISYNDNPSGGWWQNYTEDMVTNWLRLNASNPDKYPIANWQNAAFNKFASKQTHSILVSAGNKTIRTKASLRYDKSDGLYVNKDYNRIMARVNNDIEISKYVSAHFDVNFKRSKSVAPVDAPWYSRMTPPIYAIQWSDGRYADVKDGGNIMPRLLYGGTNTQWYNHLNGKFGIDIRPFEGFKISGVVAANMYFNKFKKFTKALTYTDYDYPDTPKQMSGHVTTKLDESRNDGYDITTQLFANYDKTINRHSISAMAGFESYYNFWESLGASRDRFATTSFPYIDRGNSTYQSTSGNADHNAYMSFFGRAAYNYAGRYLVQVNLRADGSSRFSKKYRWGYFPSASIGYVLTEEPFMKRIKQNWLSQLKIKASYGTLGNEQIGSTFPYQAEINVSEALLYGTNGPETFASAAQWNYAVEDITWETTKTWNVGVETAFFKNKFWLNADWFIKNTEDMLMNLTIPRYIGYSDPKVNAGTMSTKGFELEVGYRDHKGDFSWSVSANLSDFVSRITYLKGQDIGAENAKVNIEGGEFNEWYGYRCLGIYQTEADLEKYPARLNSNVGLGDLIYEDISGPEGVPDGIISPEYDRELLGGSLPRFTYGLRLGFNWKGLDFSMTFQGVGKQNVRMTTAMIQPMKDNWYNHPAILKDNYWSALNTAEENATKAYPKISTKSASNNYAMSDFWIFNGAYLRMKNITLSYSIPGQLLEKAFGRVVKNIKVYASANDLFCLNKYPKGWDPEVSGIGYPITTSAMLGVSVTF